MSTEIEARGSWITFCVQPEGVLALDGRGLLEFDIHLVHDLGRLPPPSWTAWHIQSWVHPNPFPEFLIRSSRRDELLAALPELSHRDLIWFEPTGEKVRSGSEGRRLPPVVMFALVSPDKFARLFELSRIAFGTPGGRLAIEMERETTSAIPLSGPRDSVVPFFTYGQPPLVLHANLEATVRAEGGISQQLVPVWLLLAVSALLVLVVVFG